jgi:hypothetical protein
VSIKDQEILLADSGPFCRFADTGHEHLKAFMDYLGPSLRVTRDVQREISNLAKTEFPRLKDLEWTGWLSEDNALTITDRRMLSQIDDIAEGQRRRRNRRNPTAERGEIATVLLAKHMKVPVLVDDGEGKDFATKKGVMSFDTEQLCVEMAIAGALTEDQAFEVYGRVYKGTRQKFNKALADARA